MSAKLWQSLGLAAIVAITSCVQILDADHEYQVGDGEAENCVTDSHCDDMNACTEDTCSSDKICIRVPFPDGPLPTQITGDCRQDQCILGQFVTINDDADVVDDNNSCTTDTCSDGMPVQTPLSDNVPCTIGQSMGLCMAGSCMVECTDKSECNDSNPCTEDLCDQSNNKCTFMKLDGIPVPQASQQPGDCKENKCVNGIATPVDDNADIPDDGNICTEDLCLNGTPSNPPVALDTPCSFGRFCNATGQCVECNSPNQCDGTDTFCRFRTCNNNNCSFGNTPTDTPLPPMDQTPGDCRELQCSFGGTKSRTDSTDVPDDGNDCTMDYCSFGDPLNVPVPRYTPCMAATGDACDGNGACKYSNGKACTMGTECASGNCVDGVCCDGTCTTACRACNIAGNVGTCVTLLNQPDTYPANVCDGSKICNANGACKKINGETCTTNSDCATNACVDGVCCDNACLGTCQTCNLTGSVGTCSNVPVGQTDNNPINTCGGTSQCNGSGACLKINGTNCSTNAECLTGNCVDGLCCDSACGGTCEACTAAKKGQGSDGTCGPIIAGADPDNECPANCDGAGMCAP